MASHPLGPWAGESLLPVAATPDGSAVVLIGEVREDRDDASFDLLKIRFDGDTLLHRAWPDPADVWEISASSASPTSTATGSSAAAPDLPGTPELFPDSGG